MRTSDYDSRAHQFDRRYRTHGYEGIADTLLSFAAASARSLEVGAGTGHWLKRLHDDDRAVVGLDPSAQMLGLARHAVPSVPLVRGRAEALPYAAHSFDRVFCINALHHFTDKARFLAETHRVLRQGGGLMTAGIDPHGGQDNWWVHEYFPETVNLDLERYPSAADICAMMAGAGFIRCETREVHHISRLIRVALVRAEGWLDRGFTSQLAMLSDDEYARGLERLSAAERHAERQGKELLLNTDIRFLATIGWQS